MTRPFETVDRLISEYIIGGYDLTKEDLADPEDFAAGLIENEVVPCECEGVEITGDDVAAWVRRQAEWYADQAA